MIERKHKRTARIGIFAVAHAVYWEQFEGLYDNIMKYHQDLVDKVETNDVEVIDFGMVDSSMKAYETVKQAFSYEKWAEKWKEVLSTFIETE